MEQLKEIAFLTKLQEEEVADQIQRSKVCVDLDSSCPDLAVALWDIRAQVEQLALLHFSKKQRNGINQNTLNSQASTYEEDTKLVREEINKF